MPDILALLNLVYITFANGQLTIATKAMSHGHSVAWVGVYMPHVFGVVHGGGFSL